MNKPEGETRLQEGRGRVSEPRDPEMLERKRIT